jgi:hypothetical protein
VSGSRKAYADDERTWEVGQLRNTCEVAERGRGTGSGGDGGKGLAKGNSPCRFESSDLPHLANCGGSGIVCSVPVPRTRIVGKACLHLKPESELPPYDATRPLNHRHELLELLSSKRALGVSAEQSVARETACHPDSFAGPDDAAQIALEWGTPQIKDMIKKGNITFNDYF